LSRGSAAAKPAILASRSLARAMTDCVRKAIDTELQPAPAGRPIHSGGASF